MFGSMRRHSLVLAAMMALGAAAPALASQPRVVNVPAAASKPGRRGLFNDAPVRVGFAWYGRKGAGISMATQKRIAAKLRNVVRNRRSHR